MKKYLLALIITLASRGFLFLKIYSWFFMKQLGLPQISYIDSIGMCFFLALLRKSEGKANLDDFKKFVLQIIAEFIVIFTISLIIHLISEL